MAYKVSQIRKKSGNNTYMQTIDVTPSTMQSPNKFSNSSLETFTDFALLGDFRKNEVYYLRFIMHRIPEGFYSRTYPGQYAMFNTSDDMTYTLILKQNDEEDEETNPPQVIDEFTVNSLALSEKGIGSNTIYYSYTTVFVPNKTCGLLGFRLARTAYDILSMEGQRNWLLDKETDVEKQVYDDSGKKFIVSTKGQRLIYTGENGDICILKDIVVDSNQYPWLKMGFQSRPGTLIVVNKQPIRVGRSGTYEINNGTSIESFMITAPQGSDNSKIDAFLLDYAYNS